MLSTGKWILLEVFVLRDVSQSQRDKYMFSLIYGSLVYIDT